MPKDRKQLSAEDAAYEEMRAREVAWFVERYEMSAAGAEKLLKDLARLRARTAFDAIDTRAEGRRQQGADMRRKVLAILPQAIERARSDAKRHGKRRAKTGAVNSWAAEMAGCSVRFVEKVRAESKG